MELDHALSSAIHAGSQIAQTIDWSRWSRVENSFSLMLMPRQPGIFAIAEEIVVPGAGGAFSTTRTLAVIEVAAAEDLARALSSAFSVASPWRQRLLTSRCYIRYAVIEDEGTRAEALRALQHWMRKG